jgi:hypothetical protein
VGNANISNSAGPRSDLFFSKLLVGEVGEIENDPEKDCGRTNPRDRVASSRKASKSEDGSNTFNKSHCALNKELPEGIMPSESDT